MKEKQEVKESKVSSKRSLSEMYDKYYKIALIIPIIILILSIGYLFNFAQQNGDIIKAYILNAEEKPENIAGWEESQRDFSCLRSVPTHLIAPTFIPTILE